MCLIQQWTDTSGCSSAFSEVEGEVPVCHRRDIAGAWARRNPGALSSSEGVFLPLSLLQFVPCVAFRAATSGVDRQAVELLQGQHTGPSMECRPGRHTPPLKLLCLGLFLAGVASEGACLICLCPALPHLCHVFATPVPQPGVLNLCVF